LAIRRELAAARPEAQLPYLAEALNNLGIRLGELGFQVDALSVLQEAVGIWRKLAMIRPDAHLPILATTLNNLGVELRAVRRHEDALAVTEEGLNIRRLLFAVRPDAFKPKLANSLNNYGNNLHLLKRYNDALDAMGEAIVLYRKLALARPEKFRPYLAASLLNFSLDQSATGDSLGAVASSKDAISELAVLFFKHPPAFARNMRQMVSWYLWHCEGCGRTADAALLSPIVAMLDGMPCDTKPRED
jgi:tetratricopeptide (TPR) repeat protein